MDLATELRARLVDSLVDAGVLRDPRWVRAFREVPRDVFLPGFFVQRHDGTWSAMTPDSPDWLTAVYRNQVCVTQLDGDDSAWERARRGGAVGVPTSSSSMPTIMAIMLEALELDEGHRVLEIGAGTGYNAALLCHFLGQERVTTVDVDPGVLARAARHLALAGYRPACVLGDGERGCPERAPYDRVLGTCAVSRVPTAWLAQTRPGGLVVTTLNRALGAGLVRVESDGAGGGVGRVLREDGRFMPLRAHAPTWSRAALEHARTAPPEDSRTTELSARSVVEASSGFEFFAGLVLGDVVVGFDPVRLAHPDGSWARHRHGVVEQGGPRRLWDLAEEGYRRWRALDRPRRQRFGVTVTPDAQWFWLDAPNSPHRWPL
ncbi:methyltransferase domain-containing protein [Saccharothrix coeruleofusca]|uniref:Protein-L-isoaspartate O-methyltransferase n=1 Tax=Saccharothrix coeruleofusca TaxID=33919 RepID=A0A918ALD7_9PSEU|nr:methyltransferase domain-containing protein [Saccharothrix coeruleofusca]GGP56723.1 protein-L-isoaspartate O-methyltransferase [Saccharothrix coeruleofusca]